MKQEESSDSQSLRSDSPSARMSAPQRKSFLEVLKRKNGSKYIIGLSSLAFVILGWSSTSYLIEYILDRYKKPLFITYLGTAVFQIYFLQYFLISTWKARSRRDRPNIESPTALPLKLSPTETDDGYPAFSFASTPAPTRLPPMTIKEMLFACLPYYPIYVLATYLGNTSFGLTDVLAASILLSTSCLFTLIFSIVFKLERFSVMKALSVMISVIGVLIVWIVAMNYDENILEKSSTKNYWQGNLYAIVSAFLYGIYSVMLKKIAVDEDRVNMTFFFGLVGFLSTVTLWPLFFIFNATGFETFELPSGEIFGLLTLNYIFGTLLPNFFWGLAVLYTSPLVTAIGVSLNTPVSVLINVIWNGENFFNFRLLASIFMIMSFVMVNLTALYPRFNYFFENRFCPTWQARRRRPSFARSPGNNALHASSIDSQLPILPMKSVSSVASSADIPADAPADLRPNMPEKELSYLTPATAGHHTFRDTLPAPSDTPHLDA